ncbi:hypothetical protein [Erwinia tracheiphila]|uniref:hypothetical protein n=1 Tax=Erwinia tracheiphila TaxID=65700 RepID=UPI0003AAFC73|nr:hypothetical protein [Erwinia tracheiphila]UIA83171.1 hypothetical protein LU604_22905 [Erwinia tracheiphila]UIA91750.1 hypothetical protein LU632_22370 [Erwinia tracheiphila]
MSRLTFQYEHSYRRKEKLYANAVSAFFLVPNDIREGDGGHFSQGLQQWRITG